MSREKRTLDSCTVESQVTVLKLERMKIKDGKWEARSAATRECTSCQQGDVYIT